MTKIDAKAPLRTNSPISLTYCRCLLHALQGVRGLANNWGCQLVAPNSGSDCIDAEASIALLRTISSMDTHYVRVAHQGPSQLQPSPRARRPLRVATRYAVKSGASIKVKYISYGMTRYDMICYSMTLEYIHDSRVNTHTCIHVSTYIHR